MAYWIDKKRLLKSIRFNINNSVMSEDSYEGAIWVLRQIEQTRGNKNLVELADDVAEVIHAKWIINSDGYYPYCSSCKKIPECGVMSKYCPECGARMKKE